MLTGATHTVKVRITEWSWPPLAVPRLSTTWTLIVAMPVWLASGLKNKVAFARQAYNDAVMSYNNNRETFPSSVVAGMFNFQAAQPLEIAKPEAREAPKVSFS